MGEVLVKRWKGGTNVNLKGISNNSLFLVIIMQVYIDKLLFRYHCWLIFGSFQVIPIYFNSNSDNQRIQNTKPKIHSYSEA